MNKTIYIIDFIGIHSGVRYYMDSFKNALSSIDNVDVKFISNFSESEDEKTALLNHYIGNKVSKIFKFLINLKRLHSLISKDNTGIYIYTSYGTLLDIIALRIISKAKRHLVDIHEAICQPQENNKKYLSKFSDLFSNRINYVISHSQRTDNFLIKFGYKGKKFNVPHFKYQFPKNYNISNISKSLFDAISKEKINILFFGSVNESKGIDILFDSINLIGDDTAQKLNFIIAGKDYDGSWRKVELRNNRSVNLFLRHISDEELNFLYSKVDYIAMPYRKSSQSGVIETAFYFKKPVIATNIPYFKMMLDKFPSFGLLSGNPNSQNYAKALEGIINRDSSSFFKEEDYLRYENRNEIKDFVIEFEKWIKSLYDE